MNTKHHRIGIGIAALIAGAITLGPAIAVDAANRPSPDRNKKPNPALVVDAYHRPSPDFNKRPKPGAFAVPCPAADGIPECDLHRTVDTTTGSSAASLRAAAVASGGGAATVSPARVTPSPR
jgi:hypothetical protein